LISTVNWRTFNLFISDPFLQDIPRSLNWTTNSWRKFSWHILCKFWNIIMYSSNDHIDLPWSVELKLMFNYMWMNSKWRIFECILSIQPFVSYSHIGLLWNSQEFCHISTMGKEAGCSVNHLLFATTLFCDSFLSWTDSGRVIFVIEFGLRKRSGLWRKTFTRVQNFLGYKLKVGVQLKFIYFRVLMTLIWRKFLLRTILSDKLMEESGWKATQ
jgi:hypothetical protein